MAYANLMYMPFGLMAKKGEIMLETILLIIIFITGIYFGSFFTLATYRIPKGENIIYKHSYCPSCNHKLGLLDLVPIFSYIFLGGKCRYCKKDIGIRYFLFEALTGLVFVLFAISFKLDVYSIDLSIIIYFCISVLYLSSLFIIAGIEKEQNTFPNSLLVFACFTSIIYIIYSYALGSSNVYEYVIYLCIIIMLFLVNTIYFKKKLKYNYYIQLLILLLYITVFSGVVKTIYTVGITIIAIAIKNIIKFFKKKSTKIVEKKQRSPIAFYMCVSNIITIIVLNLMTNYMIK